MSGSGLGSELGHTSQIQFVSVEALQLKGFTHKGEENPNRLTVDLDRLSALVASDGTCQHLHK